MQLRMTAARARTSPCASLPASRRPSIPCRQKGFNFAIRHCANSGAVVDYPELQLDMVRPGIILYGMEPSDSVQHPLDLRPAMELKTVISQKKSHSRRGNGQLWPHLYRRKGNHHRHGSHRLCRWISPEIFGQSGNAGTRQACPHCGTGVHGSADAGCDGHSRSPVRATW